MRSGRQHVCLSEWPATDIVWPASKRERPTMTESWLGAPKTANSDGRGGGGRVRECERVCACVCACVHA